MKGTVDQGGAGGEKWMNNVPRKSRRRFGKRGKKGGVWRVSGQIRTARAWCSA